MFRGIVCVGREEISHRDQRECVRSVSVKEKRRRTREWSVESSMNRALKSKKSETVVRQGVSVCVKRQKVVPPRIELGS